MRTKTKFSTPIRIFLAFLILSSALLSKSLPVYAENGTDLEGSKEITIVSNLADNPFKGTIGYIGEDLFISKKTFEQLVAGQDVVIVGSGEYIPFLENMEAAHIKCSLVDGVLYANQMYDMITLMKEAAYIFDMHNLQERMDESGATGNLKSVVLFNLLYNFPSTFRAVAMERYDLEKYKSAYSKIISPTLSDQQRFVKETSSLIKTWKKASALEGKDLPRLGKLNDDWMKIGKILGKVADWGQIEEILYCAQYINAASTTIDSLTNALKLIKLESATDSEFRSATNDVLYYLDEAINEYTKLFDSFSDGLYVDLIEEAIDKVATYSFNLDGVTGAIVSTEKFVFDALFKVSTNADDAEMMRYYSGIQGLTKNAYFTAISKAPLNDRVVYLDQGKLDVMKNIRDLTVLYLRTFSAAYEEFDDKTIRNAAQGDIVTADSFITDLLDIQDEDFIALDNTSVATELLDTMFSTAGMIESIYGAQFYVPEGFTYRSLIPEGYERNAGNGYSWEFYREDLGVSISINAYLKANLPVPPELLQESDNIAVSEVDGTVTHHKTILGSHEDYYEVWISYPGDQESYGEQIAREFSELSVW